MKQYFKIILLLVLVIVPAFDIAVLDPQEPTDHYSEANHTDSYDAADEADLHCICHVLHQGAALSIVPAAYIADHPLKVGPITNISAQGEHPKPGLHPPSVIRSTI